MINQASIGIGSDSRLYGEIESCDKNKFNDTSNTNQRTDSLRRPAGQVNLNLTGDLGY